MQHRNYQTHQSSRTEIFYDSLDIVYKNRGVLSRCDSRPRLTDGVDLMHDDKHPSHVDGYAC